MEPIGGRVVATRAVLYESLSLSLSLASWPDLHPRNPGRRWGCVRPVWLMRSSSGGWILSVWCWILSRYFEPFLFLAGSGSRFWTDRLVVRAILLVPLRSYFYGILLELFDDFSFLPSFSSSGISLTIRRISDSTWKTGSSPALLSVFLAGVVGWSEDLFVLSRELLRCYAD